MAVIVKLGSNDPKKRPSPKGAAAATAQVGSRSRGGERSKWFQDRRVLAGGGAALVIVLLVWTLLSIQPPKPVEFPQTRATVDEYDPSKEAVPNPASQPSQAPAYDPN